MGQILGSTQNVAISTDGGTSYKTLVCLRTSSVNTTVNITTESTNCGSLSAPGLPSMSLDFDAICETAPSGTQITYSDMLDYCVNRTMILAKFEDAGSNYLHEFDGYVSAMTINQATDEFINFSGTIVSNGGLTIL